MKSQDEFLYHGASSQLDGDVSYLRNNLESGIQPRSSHLNNFIFGQPNLKTTSLSPCQRYASYYSLIGQKERSPEFYKHCRQALHREVFISLLKVMSQPRFMQEQGLRGLKKYKSETSRWLTEKGDRYMGLGEEKVKANRFPVLYEIDPSIKTRTDGMKFLEPGELRTSEIILPRAIVGIKVSAKQEEIAQSMVDDLALCTRVSVISFDI